jgi:lytic murein transglycosylase
MTGQLPLSRRAFFPLVTGAIAYACDVRAQGARPFAQWVESFRSRATERGVSDETYTRVMANLKPDMSVFDAVNSQPEFNEKIWQYLNRRVSDWRIQTGKQKLKEHGALLARIEKDTGVSRTVLLALWGIESAYGDPDVQKSSMRPVFPSLAALAWGEPRRRKYWEQELINALRIVERGWSTPAEMRGSWAGAMGHTQWMPEVWLNVGMDYDGDGRVSPFGRPDDALASTAQYLLKRGKWRRGERWGYEVKAGSQHGGKASKSYGAWQKAGVARADGRAFPSGSARLWVPEPGGPGFLLGPNFQAVRSYNPSNSYALAIVHLADVINGADLLAPKFPGGERPPTLAEIQEIQRRLTALGFDTKGADGRVGAGTMSAVSNYQRKVGLEADGYAGVSLLARLRKGS